MDYDLSLLIFHLGTLFSGTLCMYLGYRLFMAGVTSAAGDLNAKTKELRITLTHAAPGTFFALFGAVIICWEICNGPEIARQKMTIAPDTSANEFELKKIQTLSTELNESKMENVQLQKTNKILKETIETESMKLPRVPDERIKKDK